MDGRQQTFFISALVALVSTIGVLMFLGNVLAPYRTEIAVLVLVAFFGMIALVMRGMWISQNKSAITYNYHEEAMIEGDLPPGFKERTRQPYNDTLCG